MIYCREQAFPLSHTYFQLWDYFHSIKMFIFTLLLYHYIITSINSWSVITYTFPACGRRRGVITDPHRRITITLTFTRKGNLESSVNLTYTFYGQWEEADRPGLKATADMWRICKPHNIRAALGTYRGLNKNTLGNIMKHTLAPSVVSICGSRPCIPTQSYCPFNIPIIYSTSIHVV